MSVTATHIKKALQSVGGYGGQPWSMTELARGANEALRQAGITTREGAAVLVAQCMVESAYFRTTAEYRAKRGTSAYDNQQRYAPYYGAGFIQVTWQSNYRKFGQWCKQRGLLNDSEYFVRNPERLSDEKWSWLTAVWYMTANNLIGLANEGENLRVGMGIHAGDPYADRRGYPWADWGRTRIKHTTAAYDACLRAGISAPDAGPWRYDFPDGLELSVEDVQRAVGVTVDGIYGPGTRDAVKALQKKLGVTADGLYGSGTEKAYLASIKPGGKPAPEPETGPKPEPAPKPWRYDFPSGVDMTVREVQKAVGVKVDGIYGASTRDAVESLQKRLGVTADGLWGKGTEKAYLESIEPEPWRYDYPDNVRMTVKALQRALGVTADGIYGEGTRDAVKRLQRSLNKVFPSYSDLATDGLYGRSTEKVIKEVQRRSGLAADGIIGAKTKRALRRSGVNL